MQEGAGSGLGRERHREGAPWAPRRAQRCASPAREPERQVWSRVGQPDRGERAGGAVLAGSWRRSGEDEMARILGAPRWDRTTDREIRNQPRGLPRKAARTAFSLAITMGWRRDYGRLQTPVWPPRSGRILASFCQRAAPEFSPPAPRPSDLVGPRRSDSEARGADVPARFRLGSSWSYRGRLDRSTRWGVATSRVSGRHKDLRDLRVTDFTRCSDNFCRGERI